MSTQNEVQAAIDQLKRDGYKVNFAHWRVPDGGTKPVRYSRKEGYIVDDEMYGLDWEYAVPSSSGGKTQCYISVQHGLERDDGIPDPYAYGVTKCRSNEQFCYAQGRRVALVRAIEILMYIEPQSRNSVYNSLRGELWAAIHEYWKKRGQMPLKA